MAVQVFLSQESVQNERAAGIADTDQRGLGMLPQQTNCEDCTRGKIEKISEPVQVYTACQFVKPQNSAPLSSKSPSTSKIRIIL